MFFLILAAATHTWIKCSACAKGQVRQSILQISEHKKNKHYGAFLFNDSCFQATVNFFSITDGTCINSVDWTIGWGGRKWHWMLFCTEMVFLNQGIWSEKRLSAQSISYNSDELSSFTLKREIGPILIFTCRCSDVRRSLTVVFQNVPKAV